jgi:DNA primase
MQDIKEEVRARLNIEDVIGEYVHLKRAGRNFKGISPFSSEKTPSFYVSPDKNIWHDFSSNKGGDIFTFVMDMEGIDFRSALEHLARKAGIDLTLYDNKGAQELAARKKRLLMAHEMAANYYQQSLVQNQHAIDYVFKKRGLSKQIVQNFKIGYAPDSGDALVQFLTKKGFSKQELSQAGLVNRFGGDLFRGRMTVPLMDGTGNIIGFTGRIINDNHNAPKYLNTPQTLLYDKSRHVFGLSQAKESIRSNDYVVIVEGNLDVVSSHQVGICQVVATAGTAMTEYHLKSLVRLSSHVRLAFDGDKAGLAATERAIPIAQNVGVELSIISMPDGAKDPDELIKKDVNLWRQAIDKSMPAVDWTIWQYSLREDLETASGKRRFTTAALAVVGMLQDSVEQEHYLTKIAKISNSSIDALKIKLDKNEIDEAPIKDKKAVLQFIGDTDPSSYQDTLLALLIDNIKSRSLLKSFDIETFDGEEKRAVARYLLLNNEEVIKDIPKQLQTYDNYVKILLLIAETRFADWNNEDRYNSVAEMLRKVAVKPKKIQKDILIEQLRSAENLGDDEKANEIRNTLNKLIKEIQNGKR